VTAPTVFSTTCVAGVAWALLLLGGCAKEPAKRAATPPADAPSPVAALPAADGGAPVDDAALVPGPDAIHATVLSLADLSPAERLYGRAPQPHPSIRYQKDVVLMPAGAGAIRGVSPNGLIWTIDARAAGADDLAAGKVAFITGRCVGRVLHLTRRDNDVELLLGPVELTDIFKTMELTVTQPLDLAQSLELPTPQFDGVEFPLDGDQVKLPPSGVDMRRLMGATRGPPAVDRYGGAFLPVQVSPGIPQRINVGFHTKPLLNGKGFGAELRHEGKGVVIVAQAQLQISTPELDLYIRVQDDKVHTRLILKNSAGLLLAFDAISGDDFSRNVHWHMPFRGVSFPLGGPLPFSIDFRHSVDVETVFSGKRSQFSLKGEYGLKGDFGVVFTGTDFMTVGPHAFTTVHSVFDNMSGASIGPRGVVLQHQLNIVAGVGYLGFTAGPSASIHTSLGAARGSDIGIVRCAGATLAIQMTGGVGWTIPAGLAEAVNTVLSLFRVDPIPDHGGAYLPWQFVIGPKTAGAEAGVCGGGSGGT
jgi:hypothetical protein